MKPILFLTPLLLLPGLVAGSDPVVDARTEIVATYPRTLDASTRGDADAALQMDTNDWVSITLDQKPRTRREMEPFVRRDIASLKPPPDWSATWKPDYERNGERDSGLRCQAGRRYGRRALPGRRDAFGNLRYLASCLERFPCPRYLHQDARRLEAPEAREVDGQRADD